MLFTEQLLFHSKFCQDISNVCGLTRSVVGFAGAVKAGDIIGGRDLGTSGGGLGGEVTSAVRNVVTILRKSLVKRFNSLHCTNAAAGVALLVDSVAASDTLRNVADPRVVVGLAWPGG